MPFRNINEGITTLHKRLRAAAEEHGDFFFLEFRLPFHGRFLLKWGKITRDRKCSLGVKLAGPQTMKLGVNYTNVSTKSFLARFLSHMTLVVSLAETLL